MEIQYADCRFDTLIAPYRVGGRHFQMAFSHGTPPFADNLSGSTLSLRGRVKHLFLGIIEYVPIVGYAAIWIDWYFNSCESPGLVLEPKALSAILKTPKFNGYHYKGDPKAPVRLFDRRPADLLYRGLLGRDPTTRPGSGTRFQFHHPASVRRAIYWGTWWDTPIEVSAREETAILFARRGKQSEAVGEKALQDYMGDKTFRISHRELQATIDSQKIYVSSLIPKEFYLTLKAALQADNASKLPRYGSLSWLTTNNHRYPNLKRFLRRVEANPRGYGFTGEGDQLTFKQVWKLNLYQIGAMVVKTEDWRCLVDQDCKIEERKVGAKDAIHLINASGIRGMKQLGTKLYPLHQKIMEHTLRSAMLSVSKDGHLVVPAIGMGIWQGDPGVYWRALLDAAMHSGKHLKGIYVNPNHQKTPSGCYRGSTGQEFASILAEYKQQYPNSESLRKVVNLCDRGTNVLFLAKNLKKEYPDTPVALLNASDPDVTLGNRIGMYVNSLSDDSTTEENYTAVGTNGLGFDEITRALSNASSRVIQTVPLMNPQARKSCWRQFLPV